MSVQMRNATKKICILFTVFSFVMGLAGCQYLYPPEEAIPTPPPIIAKEITYTTQEVVRGDIVIEQRISSKFMAESYIALYFDQSGYIEECLVSYGDDVKAGDVLIQMDPGDLDERIEDQDIAYQKAQISYNQARSSGNTYQRQSAQLDLDLAKLRLERLQKQRESLTLIAPISGKITYRAALNAGTSVAAQQTVLHIADTSKLLLFYEGEHANKFAVGEAVEVQYKNKNYTGEIVASPVTDAVSGTLFTQVYTRVNGLDMSTVALNDDALVTTKISELKNVLLVPTVSVKTFGSRSYVVVLNADGSRTEYDVQVGQKAIDQTEILKGLTEGQKVIIG